MRADDTMPDNFNPAPAPESVMVEAAELAVPVMRRRRRADHFIKLPMVWADRLDSARFVATAKVAHHLLRQSFKDRRDTIRLANGFLATRGVTPGQKWRALKELEALGLISIENRLRKSPDITLLYPRENE